MLCSFFMFQTYISVIDRNGKRSATEYNPQSGGGMTKSDLAENDTNQVLVDFDFKDGVS